MMCVLTMPIGAPGSPVEMLPATEVAVARSDSDAENSCAWTVAKPMRADTMVDLEKYIVAVVLVFQKSSDELSIRR